VISFKTKKLLVVIVIPIFPMDLVNKVKTFALVDLVNKVKLVAPVD
jgi:hypothetical protein